MTLVDARATRVFLDAQRPEHRSTQLKRARSPAQGSSSPDSARRQASSSKSGHGTRKKIRAEVVLDPVQHPSPAASPRGRRRSAQQAFEAGPEDYADRQLSSDDEQTRQKLSGGKRSPAPSPDHERAAANPFSPTRSSHHDFSASDADDGGEEQQQQSPRSPRRSDRLSGSRSRPVAQSTPPANVPRARVARAAQAQVRRGEGGQANIEEDAGPRVVRRSTRIGGKGKPRT